MNPLYLWCYLHTNEYEDDFDDTKENCVKNNSSLRLVSIMVVAGLFVGLLVHGIASYIISLRVK